MMGARSPSRCLPLTTRVDGNGDDDDDDGDDDFLPSA